MEHSTTLDTALGQIHVSVRAQPGLGSNYRTELRVVEPELELPPGMSVRRVRAVLLLACSQSGFEQLDYRCRFVTDLAAGPESGEHLEAQSWAGEHAVVVVGTEDGEAMVRRMPWLETWEDPLALVAYQRDGLNVRLTDIPAGEAVGLHYVVAENAHPEPVECSAWYAVAIQHERLLQVGSYHRALRPTKLTP